jgi:hypothetical protein
MAKKAKKRPVAKAKAKRKQQVILPKKLSALIKIALRDIRKAEALPKQFIVEMSDWYAPENVECRTRDDILIETHKICSVCAAGSVMAFSLGARKNHPNEGLSPCRFPRNEKQLNAINELREGSASQAYYCLGLKFTPEDSETLEELNTGIPNYDREDPEPFHEAMTDFQESLKEAGY